MNLSIDEKKILETDFSRQESNRQEMNNFKPLVQRGSFRISQGLVRTESEQRDYLRQGLELPMPTTKSRSGFVYSIRRIFG